MRAELGRPRSGWERLAPYVVESWVGFWLWVLAAGALGGLFLWWVGGWWYRVRLRWSGAENPDARLARLLFVYASFVFAGPKVAATVIQTAVYPDYATAYATEDWFSLAPFIFLFWSISTSYLGVRTLFQVTRWKAQVWFVVLPLVYLLALGLIVALLTLIEEVA